jgi:UDP-N-acetylmuramoyl-tripeptide--D-alanyl-D-alanine ligase
MTVGPATHDLGFALAAMKGILLQTGRGASSTSAISSASAWSPDHFAGAAADSRQVARGQIFFALPGATVDGFAFCAQAVAAGASVLVVAGGRGVPPGCESASVVAVADPLAALGDLASAVRARFAGRVIGVTGSNGKTTTKELIAAALAPSGGVLRTPGNFNTEVGLPLTILSARGDEAFWVLEMAMRGRGEIALLARIARPHIGVITNVAGAHLERLGSIEEVAHAKGELFAGLIGAGVDANAGRGGIAILPAGDRLIEAEADAAAIPADRRVTFDGERRGDVHTLELIPAGTSGSIVRYAVGQVPVVVRLPLAGAHNARNAGAALAVALAAGVPIPAAARALETLTLPPHRSAVLSAGDRTILDDCYNANPASMRAALASVAASAPAGARSFAILGDMLEVGPDAEALHREIGAEAARQLRGGLAGVGPLGAAIVAGARAAGLEAARAVTASSPEEAARQVASWTSPGDWILVKASRGMKLERAVDSLVGALKPTREPEGA